MTHASERADALRRALPPALGDERNYVSALVHCAETLMDTGYPSMAAELIEDALKSLNPLSEGLRLEILVARVRAIGACRREDDCLKAADTLLASPLLLSPDHRRARLRVMIAKGRSLWRSNQATEALELLTSARSELLNHPDSVELAVCTLELSSVELLLGHLQSARSHAIESIASSRRSMQRSVEGDSLANLAMLDAFACYWSSSAALYRDAIAILESVGDWARANRARRGLAIVLWKRGREHEAMQQVLLCIRDAQEHNSTLYIWYSHLLKGMILIHSGSFEEAQSVLTTGAQWDVPRSTSRPSLLTSEFLGDIHLEQGEAQPALTQYDEVLQKAIVLIPKGDVVAELRRRRAECYLLLGRPEEAYREAGEGLHHCNELGDRYEGAATHRILALSAAVLGRPEEADQWFRHGFDRYEEIETPYEWGKLWLAYGDWLSGDKAGSYASDEEALAAYRSAFDLFDRMGAKARRSEAERRLETLTARVSGAAPATPGNDSRTPPSPRPRRRPNSEVEKRSRWAFQTLGILTHDRGLLSVIDDVEKIAKSRKPVLVVGESGTGKELIASALHELSGRSGTYMPINCAAIPREIIESELFGHLAGSFTGSTRDKVGLLEVCDKGTVFLDEIGEMPVELQSRLLRFLETGELRRVGATRNQRVSTRVVAATNVDLSTLESGDAFRRDLFYRLAHLVIELPPLRIRRGDILLLAEHFLREAASEEGKSITLSEAAIERLQTYSWPGNVRQLRSEMSRVALLLPDGHVVRPIDLRLRDADTPGTLTQELGQAEKRRVADAMTRSHGSKSEAAKALGIPRTTLINKLKRYGLFR